MALSVLGVQKRRSEELRKERTALAAGHARCVSVCVCVYYLGNRVGYIHVLHTRRTHLSMCGHGRPGLACTVSTTTYMPGQARPSCSKQYVRSNILGGKSWEEEEKKARGAEIFSACIHVLV